MVPLPDSYIVVVGDRMSRRDWMNIACAIGFIRRRNAVSGIYRNVSTTMKLAISTSPNSQCLTQCAQSSQAVTANGAGFPGEPREAGGLEKRIGQTCQQARGGTNAG